MSTLYLFLIVYAIINLVALAYYVVDKHKAKNGSWRISEATLLGLAFLGPFGAALGMQLVRHKTRKPKFKLVYVFLVLHLLVLGYIFLR